MKMLLLLFHFRLLSNCIKSAATSLKTKMINYFLCFKQQEEELSQARDELNKIREEETKLEREASFK